jgi:hypothetical protein
VWRLPFTNLNPGNANVVKGEWIPWEGHDEASVSLDRNGDFTYHLMLDFPDDPATTLEDEAFNCNAHFTGHLTN